MSDCVFDFANNTCIHCGYVARKPDTRRRCGSPPQGAGMFARVSRYATAVARWIAAGRPTRTDQQVAALLANCEACEHYADGACRKCGCRVSASPNALANKLRMLTESCPIGRWGADAPASKPGELRVGFVLPNLGLGGVEQWLAALCKEWSRESSPIHVSGVAHVGGSSYFRASVASQIAAYAPIVSTVDSPAVHRVASNHEAVYAVGQGADVLIVWSVHGDTLRAIREVAPACVVGVSHGCSDWWMRDAHDVVTQWAAVSSAAALAVPVPCPAESVRVLANGIDLDRITPRRTRAEVLASVGIPEAARVVLYHGRLSAEKRVDRIAASMDHWPDDAWFWCVGDGPHRAAIIDACTRPDQLRLSEPIEHIGDALGAAALAVSASESEGHSLAADECLAAGLPLVTTPVGVLPDYPYPQAIHWIAANPDAGHIGRAVAAALECTDYIRWARLAAWVRSQHSAAAMANRWAEWLTAVTPAAYATTR